MAGTTTDKGWNDKSDDDLLEIIIASSLEPEQKAQAILSIRERRVAEKHNRLVLYLTIAVAFATLLQGTAAAFTIYSSLQPHLSVTTSIHPRTTIVTPSQPQGGPRQ